MYLSINTSTEFFRHPFQVIQSLNVGVWSIYTTRFRSRNNLTPKINQKSGLRRVAPFSFFPKMIRDASDVDLIVVFRVEASEEYFHLPCKAQMPYQSKSHWSMQMNNTGQVLDKYV
jgi:hypothetical protein